MKLIDADRMKMQLNNATVLGNFKEPFPLKFVLEFVDCLPEVLLSCPKCHGVGTYEVPFFDEDDLHVGNDVEKCLICHGTGKITIEAYEEIQKASRK